MKTKIILSLLLVFVLASFVSAQNIPPAPAPDPLVRIVSCLDSDGGLNYYENGIFTINVVKWTDNSPSFHPPENNGNSEDRCETDINEGQKERSCNPEKNILVEAYCNGEEIDLVNREYALYQKYDCSAEGKVCYNGVCVNKEDLKKDPVYIKEKADCEQQTKQVLSFWKRLYFWFSNPSGKVAFSETNGVVKDSEGNPIFGVPIKMEALCSAEYFGSTEHNIQETTTDENGEFKFNSFEIKTNLPSKFCRKGYLTSKEGYCPYSRSIDYFHCLRGMKETNFSTPEPVIDRKGNQNIYSTPDTASIKSGVKEVSLILKKVNPNTAQNEMESLEKEFSTKLVEEAPRE